MLLRHRVVLLASLALLLLFLLSGSAAAAPGKCEAFVVFDPVCEAGKTVAGKAGDIITAPVRAVAGGAVDAVTSWVADTAQWILGRVISFIDHSTTPTLDADWFTERYKFMIGLAALVLLPMLLIATIRAVMNQDLSQLGRSFFVYLPIAILGSFIAVHLTQAFLAITDSMSAAVARNVAGDVSDIFDSVGGTLSKSTEATGPAVPSFAIFFGALLLVIGSFFVWLELLIRSAAVTVAVFFLPMILAGLVWPAAMRWTKRLVEILMALIVSKFVVVAVISLATASLANPGGGGFGTVMGAAALMLMAAFSPFALLKLVPMVEGAGIDHLQGKGRGPVESMRSGGGVNQIVSVMRAKTRGRNGPGLAVAGAGPSKAAVGTAGAAGIAAARAGQAAAKAPGRRAERQAGMATGDSSGTDQSRKAAGGRVAAPSRRAPRDERGGGKS
jgi:type IV secretion system protein TrbL